MNEGDKIYMVVGNKISTCKVCINSYRYLMIELGGCKSSFVTKKRLFYSYYYDIRGVKILFIKKLWHYFPVVLIEKLKRGFKR